MPQINQTPSPPFFVLKSLNTFFTLGKSILEVLLFALFCFFLFHFVALSTVEIILSHVVPVHCAF